jgi:hypothetical protein
LQEDPIKCRQAPERCAELARFARTAEECDKFLWLQMTRIRERCAYFGYEDFISSPCNAVRKASILSTRKIEHREKDMTLKQMKFGFAAGVALALIAIVPAKAYTGQELSKNAKVSIVEARAIALKAHPGKITDEELEKEKGGTGLRYSFDIKRGAVTQEVGVDAQTGKVLENKKEGPHPD